MGIICFFPHKFSTWFFSPNECVLLLWRYSPSQNSSPLHNPGPFSGGGEKKQELEEEEKEPDPGDEIWGLWALPTWASETFVEKVLVPSQYNVPLTELLMPWSCKEQESNLSMRRGGTLFFSTGAGNPLRSIRLVGSILLATLHQAVRMQLRCPSEHSFKVYSQAYFWISGNHSRIWC